MAASVCAEVHEEENRAPSPQGWLQAEETHVEEEISQTNPMLSPVNPGSSGFYSTNMATIISPTRQFSTLNTKGKIFYKESPIFILHWLA